VNECQDNIEGAHGCVANTQPNCCDPTQGGQPLDCNDVGPTVQAVSAIAGAGIPVYVLGLPGSAPYADVLTQMAIAGGTAQMGSIDGGDSGVPAYYAVDTAGAPALSTALSAIAAKITATCTFPLASAPDPSMINVFLDEQVVPEDPINGWRLDGSTVTLLGTTCQKVLSGEVLDVRVIAGCPTVLK
jgi:hypothetical protein